MCLYYGIKVLRKHSTVYKGKFNINIKHKIQHKTKIWVRSRTKAIDVSMTYYAIQSRCSMDDNFQKKTCTSTHSITDQDKIMFPY